MTQRAYGYWTLKLFNDAIKLPLKFSLSSETPEKSIEYHTYYKEKQIKYVKMIPKDGLTEINCIEDIGEIVDKDHIEKYVNDELGVARPLSYFKGLDELFMEHQEKKADRDIDILAYKPLKDLKISQMNGRQFTAIPGASTDKGKSPNSKNVKLYKCLLDSLRDSKSFLLISFHSNCTTAEELGAMYEEDGIIRISGVYPTIFVRKNPDLVPISNDPIMSDTFMEKLKKYYPVSPEDKDLFILNWYTYYCSAVKEKGPKQVFVKKTSKKVEIVCDDLMDLLDKL